MNRFENQVVVISGGADGLGYGIAERVASEGGSVVLFDINEEVLQKAVEVLHGKGYNVEGFKVDVSSENDVKKSIEAVELKYGKIDAMVNSAGIVGPTSTSIVDYGLEDYDNIYRINLRGAFLMTKYSIMVMKKNGYGRILLISSIAGKEGNPFMSGYSSMKAGVIGLVKGVGKEYAQSGITVNGLAPAVIKTSMNENTSPDQLAYMTSKIPMGRLGTVEEVASIVSFIISKESSFNTGAIFDISGGRASY
ncbi:SDR family oxidoreductase [Maribacter sp. MMG018]|uniref:SDR family NAD(P)-dependent oxidoreductase n=1 Tax=Maribacter sp. MMG018 TaxID=2822688 RepID=UPI001B36D3B5|nr:SDR family NAD(P)-dependent oxidoreductase [Maribacter sp. MMG018]MBQ4915980.1 SDR family oxidoreductase [Maribacter sp. MMG018]